MASYRVSVSTVWQGIRLLGAATAISALGACGGGGEAGGSGGAGGSNNPPPATYQVSVTATTVAAGESFSFSMNGQTLVVNQNATKTTFATALASGTSYAVTQSGGPRTCTLSGNGSGTIAANVDVIATCGSASSGSNPPPGSGGGGDPGGGGASGSSYQGTISYARTLPNAGLNGSATVNLQLSRQFADVKHYGLQSGTFTGTFTLAGCSPVTTTVNLQAKQASDESSNDELLVWTSEAAGAYPRTHSFDLRIAAGQDLTFTCPGGSVSAPASDFVLPTGGLCVGSPVAAWSNESQLTGSHDCALELVQSVSWTLNRQ